MLLDLEGFVPVGLTEICGAQINSRKSREYQNNNKICRSMWLNMMWLIMVRYVVNCDVLSCNDGKLQAEAVAVLTHREVFSKSY